MARTASFIDGFTPTRSIVFATMRATLLEPRDRTIREVINVANPSSILTALASAWERISAWFGRSQAEQAKQQQTEIDAMDKEIQAMKGTRP